MFYDVLPRLIPSGHEADAGCVVVEGYDGFEHVHDCRAAADADVGGRGGEVVAYGEVGGVAFGGFDVHICAGWWGCGGEGWRGGVGDE